MTIGRPSKLTGTVTEKICEARQIGATWKIAAEYAGVSEAVILHWKRTGESLQCKLDNGEIQTSDLTANDRKILNFLRKVTEADTVDTINLLSVIDRAASIDAVTAEKRLSWKHKGEYNTKATVDATVSATVSASVVSVTPAELARAIKEAEEFERELIETGRVESVEGSIDGRDSEG